jgi:hypothetical protein
VPHKRIRPSADQFMTGFQRRRCFISWTPNLLRAATALDAALALSGRIAKMDDRLEPAGDG